MTLYADYEPAVAPSWLSDAVAQSLLYCLGLVKDAVVQVALDSVASRFAEKAPLDALPHLLDDFNLDQPWNETTESTRARLLSAWDQWMLAGTKAGIEAALRTAGFTYIAIQERVDPDRWWTFRVLVRPPFPWTLSGLALRTWGAGWGWGSGPYQGAYPTPYDRLRAVGTVLKWKPKHAVLTSMLAQVEGPYWGSFNWGDGTLYGGVEDIWY